MKTEGATHTRFIRLRSLFQPVTACLRRGRKGLLAPLLGAACLPMTGISLVAEDYQTVGVVNGLPVFHRRLAERVRHPMSWTSGSYADFSIWRQVAREKVFSALLTPPPAAPWNALLAGEEDRGTHVARKVVFNLTGDSRVLAYMTVPKGPGPFPAVLLLHSHDGEFAVGKEKVIRPWGIASEKKTAAESLTARAYGGRYLGDVLAQRGYVCLATDMLNWSDRGGGGEAGQSILASNLMHFGMSLAGLVAWEDLRAAEFLAQRPEVDPKRIAAMGLSVGGYRTWQLAALSERIVAGVSICWISGVKSLMTPGNNQTKGGAYTMLHAGLLGDLDYADIASIACPKPMLFYNGRHDKLFPQDGVESAYATLHAVWKSQGVESRLVTRTWDVSHTFNVEMQDAAFAWLDDVMAHVPPSQ